MHRVPVELDRSQAGVWPLSWTVQAFPPLRGLELGDALVLRGLQANPIGTISHRGRLMDSQLESRFNRSRRFGRSFVG